MELSLPCHNFYIFFLGSKEFKGLKILHFPCSRGSSEIDTGAMDYKKLVWLVLIFTFTVRDYLPISINACLSFSCVINQDPSFLTGFLITWGFKNWVVCLDRVRTSLINLGRCIYSFMKAEKHIIFKEKCCDDEELPKK